MTIQRRAAKRLWDGSGIVARNLTRRAVALSWPAKIGGAVIAWKGAPAVLEQAHQQPYLMPVTGAAWCYAAYVATAVSKIDKPSPGPDPTDTPTALTSNGSGQEGPATVVGEGFTIIDDPDNPARAIVIHKENAA